MTTKMYIRERTLYRMQRIPVLILSSLDDVVHCGNCYYSIILYIMSTYMYFVITVDVIVERSTFCTMSNFVITYRVVFAKNHKSTIAAVQRVIDLPVVPVVSSYSIIVLIKESSF